MTTPSPEALAQAREQLESEAAFRAYPAVADNLITERATVIELRRQLAQAEAARERSVSIVEELLATERQRAEAAERSRDGWHDRACKDAAALNLTEQRLAASEKRAEAAEAKWEELIGHLRGLKAAVDAAMASRVVGYDYNGNPITALAASEAKRKALREALQGMSVCGSLGQALEKARRAIAADE